MGYWLLKQNLDSFLGYIPSSSQILLFCFSFFLLFSVLSFSSPLLIMSTSLLFPVFSSPPPPYFLFLFFLGYVCFCYLIISNMPALARLLIPVCLGNVLDERTDKTMVSWLRTCEHAFGYGKDANSHSHYQVIYGFNKHSTMVLAKLKFILTSTSWLRQIKEKRTSSFAPDEFSNNLFF